MGQPKGTRMTAEQVAATPEQARKTWVWQRLLANPLGALAMTLLTLIVLASIFANILAPYQPGAAQLRMINIAPGDVYLLGGDGSGRDIMSRLLFSGRMTLVGAFITTAISAAIGISFGLWAGYRGGLVDGAISWVSDVVQVLPGIIVLVAMFTIIGPSAFMTMVVLGVMIAPSFFRLTRSLTLDIRNDLYVHAARVSGLSDWRILGRHILSVIKPPLVLHAAHIAGVAIVVQAGLEFIGLGDPGTPTWGGMLQDAFRNIYQAPFAFIWPGLAIGLTVSSLHLFGSALRDAWYDRGSVPGENVAADAETVVAAPVRRDPASPKGEALLAIEQLSISYQDGRHVVSDVSLQLAPGEILGLVGESGSGKTQTALAILGLLPQGGRIVGGRIRFYGADLASDGNRHGILGRHIGYIPQEPMSNLDPTFSIGHQLVEPLRVVLGLDARQARERALELLASVEIKDPLRVFKSFPHQISGGMAQRVLIAGAVSCNPDLLIADEPTTALDATVQAEILDIIREQQTLRNMGVLLVTHNFGVVADICNSVVVMRRGRVVESGPVLDVFANPQAAYTRRLLSLTLEDSLPRNARARGERLLPERTCDAQ
jgi:peptide/nickel transport system permease protein